MYMFNVHDFMLVKKMPKFNLSINEEVNVLNIFLNIINFLDFKKIYGSFFCLFNLVLGVFPSLSCFFYRVI